jgi:DNA-binding NarL/FixJ family response regulator
MQIDLLLADGQDTPRQLLAAALRSLPDVRVCEVETGRGAVTSLGRATFSAVVCAMELPDIRWSRLQGLIRGGACGFTHTPLLVMTDMPELASVTAAADPYTTFVRGEDPVELADQLVRLIINRPRPSVLLVEDEPQYARFCADLIQPFYEVEMRGDGRSALAAWRARRHQVIVLDLMLPGTSGEELLELIRVENPNQAVLILTSNDGAAKHQEMVLSGASAFLSKGCDAATLASAIDGVLKDEQRQVLTASLQNESERHRSVMSRLHAARYSLERGQASNATRHLTEAIGICPVRGPTDDEWTQMLEDNEERANPQGLQ